MRRQRILPVGATESQAGFTLISTLVAASIGLVLAVLIAAVAIGWGALRHRKAAPFVIAMTGLTFMGGALAVPHGQKEAILTIIGVALVSLGHILNLRQSH